MRPVRSSARCLAIFTRSGHDGRFRVRYTLATKLVNELVEAADDMVLTKTIARYGRVDLLCIDYAKRRDGLRASPSFCSAVAGSLDRTQRMLWTPPRAGTTSR